MKRRGITVLLFGAVCLFCGLASGKRELFFLTVLTLALLLAALAQAALQRPRFTLDLRSGQTVRGQAKAIFLDARNPCPWPMFPVRLRLGLLRDKQPQEELARFELLLVAREQRKLEIEVTCPHCGAYLVQPQRFYAEDVFGFFSLPGRLLPPQTLLSLPKLDLAALEEQASISHEEQETPSGRLGQHGQLSAESRPYQNGDTLRSIHWKKSASRHAMFSRLREYAADYSCCLLVDNRPCGEEEDTLAYVDRLSEAALSFLFTQISRNRAITLLPGAFTLQSAAGLPKAAALLATLSFEEDGSFVALKSLLESRSPPDTLFFLLAQPPQSLTTQLEELVNRGCEVICLTPVAAAARIEDSLDAAFTLVSIDPPSELSFWLEA